MNIGRFLHSVRIILTGLGVLCATASLTWAGQIPGFYGTIKWDAKTMKSVMDQAQFRSVIQGAQNPVYSQNRLDINQTQEKAILEWNTFNVPPEVSVNFNQAASSWVALNRIYDANPSYIFGSINAPGKVYLINQNGILFGQGSKVNVNTLIASALNITNADFLNNMFVGGQRVYNFTLDDYQGTGLNHLAAVSNQGEINASDGGAVFLMAPRVDNSGVINAPVGQIGLVAGTEVTVAHSSSDDLSRSGYYALIKDDFINSPKIDDPTFGTAVNHAGGTLLADGGIAGIYGNNVENWGTIRSVTAFKNKRGMVELRAANKITTGMNSSISLPVDVSTDPETGKPVTVDDTFDIQPVVVIRGLNRLSGTTIIDVDSAHRIEHRGMIQAPAGVVTMAADDRIYLESGSLIDVSGVDVELPASILSFKLNAIELRDSYDQKGGVLQGETITTSVTAGSSIGDLSQLILTEARTALERSIGGARRTVVDQTTGIITYNNPQTGRINLTAAGDLILKQGAVLDFSGGSVRFTEGFYDPTKLVSGGKIYDIANASLNLTYDRVMGKYTRTYERFGIRETYEGIYYGGASPLKKYTNSYTIGGDAGVLNLSAARIVLDGALHGGIASGAFQNTWIMRGSYSNGGDYDLAMALSVRRGLEIPRAGTLTIDTQGITDEKGRESSIEVRSETSPKEIQAEAPLQMGTSVLSARILNAAGLGTLDLRANLSISIAEDAALRLQPGGMFSANARRIDHQGSVTVPGGRIRVIIGQNKTSKQDLGGEVNPLVHRIDMTDKEEIIIGPASILDASGERIDNSLVGKVNDLALRSGQTTGGTIMIMDQTDEGFGVSIAAGAVVDVSGGYTINQKGKVSGGNAGLLDIQGSNILLDGDLRGHALSDANGKLLGGSVTLRSTNIRVAPHVYESPDTFVLAGTRFDSTGFTQISLYSINDVIIEPDTAIKTSPVRLGNPVPGRQSDTVSSMQISPDIGGAVPGRPDLIRLHDSTAFMAGPSSFTALAGRVFEPIQVGAESKFTGHLKQIEPLSRAKVVVSESAAVRTSPAASGVTRIANDVAEGPISVKTGMTIRGQDVEIRGELESLGGDISVTSTSTEINHGNLNMTADAQILAHGYNRPDPESTLKNYPMNYLPIAGGTVTLSAYSDLTLADVSLIDISGSDAVDNRMRTADGKVYTFREAGDPGSLSLSFGNNLIWSGMVKAKNPIAAIRGIKGGTLTVNSTRSILNVGGADIQRYSSYGFDDITLKGFPSIQFNGAINPASGRIGRKLTLDAQIINGTGQDVNLSAPWIVLTNSQAPGSPDGVSAVNGGALTLSSEGWIDVSGSFKIGGFQDVTLRATRDIRLSEKLPTSYTLAKEGDLTAKGNLTLDADRIYPGMYYGSDASGTKYSDFIVNSDKKVTIQHSSAYSGCPIYSAGGSLTVEGKEGIEVGHGGYLAAPMGKITLNSPGKRIYLADGSTLSTVGENNLGVKYGVIDEGNLWMIGYTTPVTQDQLPVKRVSLDADTVIVREGARIDVSGGGKVFAYKFQAGTAGSTDPLTKANRYLVFKDNAYQRPGTQVYLQGGGGLHEGFYTLLPLDATNARYAFMPEAYIIEAQKGAALPVAGKASFTKDGYPLTIGYQTVADTSIRGTRPQVYSVRKAAEVLEVEGDYLQPSLTAGDAGTFSISGATSILEGTLKGAAMEGYAGGTVSLSARNVIVRQTVGRILPDNFDFNGIVGPEFQNKLILSASGLSGMGFRRINLGDTMSTSTVTIESGTSETPTALNAAIISLAAKDTIDIRTNAQITSLTGKEKESGEGMIKLTTPGQLTVADGALVHATHNIELDVHDVNGLQGNIRTDMSNITLRNEAVFFFDRGASTAKGLYVTNDVWQRFSGFEDITFAGRDIQFKGVTELFASGSLTLDAARILDMKTDGASMVTLTAPTVNIKNSTAAVSSTTAPTKAEADRGTFTVNASGQINIGGGDVLFDGFKTINLVSGSDMTVKGVGSLITGNTTRGYADLNIKAARLMTGSDGSSTKKYIAPNFTIDAGTSVIKMAGIPGLSPAITPAAGGLLEIMARRIELSNVLRSDGGTIRLTTAGSETDGVFLNGEGRILVLGTEYAPGGRVYLITDYTDGTTVRSGRIELETGSLIDVSAGGQGDAGLISLSAPMGGVSIRGDLLGNAGIRHKPVSDFVAALTGNAGIASLEVAAGQNVIGFTHNGADYAATVNPQAYSDGAALATAVQAALNSAKDAAGNTIPGTPFAVTHSATSGKLTISNGNTYYAVTNFMNTDANTIPSSQLGFGPVNGAGGSLVLDTYQVSNADQNKTNTNWTQLTGMLTEGEFTEFVNIRARKGNITLAGDQTLQARHVKLTADDNSAGNGNVNIGGSIHASIPDGSGLVELYAKNDVNVNSGGVITVAATDAGAEGGQVLLSAANGYVNLNSGGTVNMSAGASGRGGTLYVRALRDSNDVKVNIGGAILGPSAVYGEAVHVYSYSGDKSIGTSDIGTSDTSGYRADTKTYMTNALNETLAGSAMKRLKPDLDAQGLYGIFTLMPGIEIQGTANLSLGTTWDLSSKGGSPYIWRYGSANNIPGVLTMRAAGNLTINANLVDHPTDVSDLLASTAKDSWGINLVAGADSTGAGSLTVVKGMNAAGNLTIADNKVIYTESAPVRFASGGDTTIGSGVKPGYMIKDDMYGMNYSLASYDGSVLGYVGRDLIINPGGAIQTATGDISISVGRDIQLNLNSSLLGAIRTTGESKAESDIKSWSRSSPITITKQVQYWTYGGGGNITLDVGRAIGNMRNGIMDTAQVDKAWDYFTTIGVRPVRPIYYYGLFAANYESHSGLGDKPTSGIAAMGGGDVTVRTGGDFLAQAGAFGDGDLTIYAGGDINGRFLNRNGRGGLHASGNFGSYEGDARNRVQIELFDSRFSVSAKGEIQISAVVNPSLASAENPGYKSVGMGGAISFMNCTYTPDTRISLKAGSDVTIAGDSPIYASRMEITETVLPATVNIEAGGDVALLNYFTLTPSPSGNLRIRAGGDIRGSDPPAYGASVGVDQPCTIMISDIAPEYWYGSFQTYDIKEEKDGGWISNRTGTDKGVSNKHGFYKDPDKQIGARPLHYNDNQPIEIYAGRDISNLQMFFPKKAEISAQRDIVDILYEGQNIRPEDVSKVRAGGNISMAYVDKSGTVQSDTTPLEGLIQGGPGAFFVQAGGSIDLGTLQEGIQAIGNGRYPQLGTGESSVVIVSGYSVEKTAEDIVAFFANVRKAGDDYAQLMAGGKLDEAAALLTKTREETISPFTGMASGTGDINMTSSQISTSIGKSDIFIIADGDMNLGKTAMPAAGKISKKSGITTGGGGEINILSIGDVNVNESRVMTFYGGDITVWSDHGNINAGRGSRAAVSASPPKVNEDGTQVFSPPAIGSGIRAVTYGDNAPEPGNIHLFAPSGIIDAGEAGISGSKVTLAGLQIKNVANINFSFGSVGVPAATSGTTGIGNLSGTSALMDKGKMAEVTSGSTSMLSQQAGQIMENIMAKWLDVKVIEFIQE